MMYTPDKWIVIKIVQAATQNTDHTLYKIFGSWGGGYLDGDSWRMNSGIERVVEEPDYYDVHGYSGSIYRCRKGGEGVTAYTGSILQGMIKDALNVNADIEVVNIQDVT